MIKYFTTCLILVYIGNLNKERPKINPPGTIELSTNIYIDENPIDNLAWQEYIFVNWVGQINTNKEIPYLDVDGSCEFIVEEKYFSEAEKLTEKSIGFVLFSLDSSSNSGSSKYAMGKMVGIQNSHSDKEIYSFNYPVIGVNKKEAERYCEWRTKAVLHVYSKMKKKKRGKHYTKVKYRLPYEDELKQAMEKFGSESDEGLFLNAENVDFKYLNKTFEEITLDGKNHEFVSPFNFEKRVGFRCVCEIEKY